MTDYAIALSYPQPDSSIDSCVSLNAHARGLHIILAIRLKRVWGKNSAKIYTLRNHILDPVPLTVLILQLNNL